MIRLKKPLRTRKGFYIFIYAGLCAMMVGIVISYLYIRTNAFNQYASSIKSEDMGLLDIYQKSYISLLGNYYSNALSTVANIATSPDTGMDIKTGQISDLTSTLQYQRVYQNQFNTIAIFNASGQLISASSDSTKINPRTTIANTNQVVQAAVARHTPTITQAYFSQAGRWVISFIAPITGSDGTFIGTVTAGTTLTDLVNRVSFLSKYTELSNVVTDSQGNILIRNNQEVSKAIDISKTSDIFNKLSASNQTKIIEGTDIYGRPVVEEGTNISISNAGKFYVISYLDKNSYAQYTNFLKKSNYRVSATFVSLNIGFFIFLMILINYLKVRLVQKD